MQNNEDEIEYFGILPVAFTADLQESLEESLKEIIQGNAACSQKVETHITEAFRKNIFIFNNFVLRNILKFPSNFKLERMITDKVIKADLNKLVEKINEKQKMIVDLQEMLVKKQNDLNIAINTKNGYENLLKDKQRYYDLVLGAREVKNFMKETKSIYERFQMNNGKKDNEFDKLMEYKNIKNEFYKSERDKLFDVAGLETLDFFIKHIE